MKKADRLETSLTFLRWCGLLVSISFAVMGMLYGNWLEDSINHNFARGFGVNPYTLLGFRFGVTAFLFISWVALQRWAAISALQLTIKLSILTSIAYMGYVANSDSDNLPVIPDASLLPVYLLKYGGILFLVVSFLAITLTVIHYLGKGRSDAAN